jgi:hypothetical protein
MFNAAYNHPSVQIIPPRGSCDLLGRGRRPIRLFRRSRKESRNTSYRVCGVKRCLSYKARDYQSCYGIAPSKYGFVAGILVAEGYLVLSLQHDLPGDAPLGQSGNVYRSRRPVWERGAANIRFVLSEIERRYPRIYSRHILLIGHSNGGDISTLFAALYPTDIAMVITLDHRRMPIPRSANPRFLSIRADEFMADPGVLPTVEERKRFGIQVESLKNTRHADLCDDGRDEMRQVISRLILKFLRTEATEPLAQLVDG